VNWLESRNGHELVRLEGAEAIQELQRVAHVLRTPGAGPLGLRTQEEAEAA
jgi:hypothetical protein